MTSSKSFFDNIPAEKIKRFQKKIFSFYESNKRDLPWRRTTDSYKILLSELMLQQTQVSRVILYYQRWVSKWPTIHALASSSLPDVLEMWMGLGYNTRAVNLHRTARKIVADFQGDVLQAMKHYKDLPGIGKYTSQAVLIFSTNADVITVDTNIRRIFISEFHLPTSISDTELWSLAETCLPHGRSRDWHNALMDYGALHLTAQKTGIKPKTQQSRFEGSDRQIRAKIIKNLLEKPQTFSELKTDVRVNQERLKPILEKMTKERIITKQKTTYQIHS